MSDPRRIWAFSAVLHKGELVAKSGDSALAEIPRQSLKGGVDHAGAGAMGEHQTCASTSGPKPQSRDRLLLVDVDFQWFSAR
jgi:hypothetical protein